MQKVHYLVSESQRNKFNQKFIEKVSPYVTDFPNDYIVWTSDKLYPLFNLSVFKNVPKNVEDEIRLMIEDLKPE